MNFIYNIAAIKTAIQTASHPNLENLHKFRLASVMALVIPSSRPELIFIQKADTKGYPWRNQMAFPGGIQDPEDSSALASALREVEEELAIIPDQVEVIGPLGDYLTINTTIIQAFCGIWGRQSSIDFDSSEISRVMDIPLHTLAAWHEKQNYHNTRPDVMELTYPFEEVTIWGVTAKIVFHLLEILIHPQKASRQTS